MRPSAWTGAFTPCEAGVLQGSEQWRAELWRDLSEECSLRRAVLTDAGCAWPGEHPLLTLALSPAAKENERILKGARSQAPSVSPAHCCPAAAKERKETRVERNVPVPEPRYQREYCGEGTVPQRCCCCVWAARGATSQRLPAPTTSRRIPHTLPSAGQARPLLSEGRPSYPAGQTAVGFV